eukprot:5361834-Ditylum_brightwellii.AAC.1
MKTEYCSAFDPNRDSSKYETSTHAFDMMAYTDWTCALTPHTMDCTNTVDYTVTPCLLPTQQHYF